MSGICVHIRDAQHEIDPRDTGCEECLATGDGWVHLRMCMTCGHVGCCDESQNKHATAHFREHNHPVVRSFEPGENWWWCYEDEMGFEIEGAPPSPSHP
jgi:uncharacterized UBP type Zn finger protein